MERNPVISSNIAEVGYDERSNTLEVQFKNGRVYQYFAVPSQEARNLIGAASHGQYLNRHIKGRYRYARV